MTLRPIPRKDVDYKNLKLQPTPEEYFLLSRVTGNVTIAELCTISMMSREKTFEALERLEQAGLIEIPRKAPPSFGQEDLSGKSEQAVPAPPSVAPATPAKPAASVAEASSAPSEVKANALATDRPDYAYFPVGIEHHRYDDAVLAEEVSLDAEQKKEILYVYDYLERVDCYALLGLNRDAERKEVRTAFFTMSKRFHPDLYFGQSLGSYQSKVEAIFQAINKAQQVLSHKQKRADYDAQLGQPMAAPVAPAKPPQASELQLRQPSPSVAPTAAPLDPAEQRKREMAFTVLLRRGEKHEMAGELVEAAKEYRNAFGIKHDAAVALRAAGLLMRSGSEHLEEAIALAKAALNENPRESRAMLLIGDAYEEQGRLDDALSYYDRILSVEPGHKVATQRKSYVEALRR